MDSNYMHPHYTDASAFPDNWPTHSNPYTNSSAHQPPTFYPQTTPSSSSPLPILVASSVVPSHGSSSWNFMEHGYIARTFGASQSRTYWAAVLKTLPEHLQLQTVPGPSTYWRIGAHDLSAGPEAAGRTLDYFLDADHAAGPVVPQQLWQPLYKRIREVLVDNTRLCMPIFFIVQESGRVGLSLADALAKKHYVLHGHNQVVDLGGKVTTHIRILWRGYLEYKRQIQIQDQTRDRNPITLGRLVEHVARTVQRFIEKPPQRNEEDFDPRWVVGPRGIGIKDILLVGIAHTSAGTWQPILRISRSLPELAQAFLSPSAPHNYSSAPPPSSSSSSPEHFSFNYVHTPPSSHYSVGHAPSPEQFTVMAHSPSPPHQYPNSYPSSPNPQQAYYADGGYLAPSPPYSAYPYS